MRRQRHPLVYGPVADLGPDGNAGDRQFPADTDRGTPGNAGRDGYEVLDRADPRDPYNRNRRRGLGVNYKPRGPQFEYD